MTTRKPDFFDVGRFCQGGAIFILELAESRGPMMIARLRLVSSFTWCLCVINGQWFRRGGRRDIRTNSHGVMKTKSLFYCIGPVPEIRFELGTTLVE
jgi:hypothetical protein